jgi:hypothetical protein
MTTEAGREQSTPLEIRSDDIPFGSSPMDVPAFYVEEIKGGFVVNGIVKLNLGEMRVDVTEMIPMFRPVLTLIIPQSAMENWSKYFLNYLPPAVSSTRDV